MSEPTAPVDATSTALVVHSHADLYPDPPIAFDLRRLPAELREKVFEQAALASSAKQRRRLLTVSREFYQATAPHAWEVVRVSSFERLEFLTETILPRCGSHVKSFRLLSSDTGFYEQGFVYRELIQALIKMPNIRSLKMPGGRSWRLEFEYFCESRHPLTVHLLESNVTPGLATMTSRAPNLLDLNVCVAITRANVAPLVAAMASLRALTTLKISGAAVLDTEVKLEWRCPPLNSLDLDLRDTAMTLPTFCTFVSHFSTTLQYLTIQHTPSFWSHHPPRVPLPLPHLIHLRLDYEEFMPSFPSFLSLPSLFVNSPIKNATLRHDTEVTGSTNDYIATCTMAMQFIEAHKETLKHLTLSLNDGDNQAERLAWRDLDVFARTSGIELEGIDVSDSSGDEGDGGDGGDGEEGEEGEEDIEDEEEEVGEEDE